MTAVSGGCQCGAVRYAAVLVGTDGYWCHCRMCQRAVGNVAAAFVNALNADVTWTGERAFHWSSPFGRRGFCGACGTPLTFDYPDSAQLDLTVGSLDDPARIALTSHFGVETRVPGWIPHDAQPEVRCDSYAPLVARWAAVREGSVRQTDLDRSDSTSLS